MVPNSFLLEIVPVNDFNLTERINFSLKNGWSLNMVPFRFPSFDQSQKLGLKKK